MEHTKHIIRAVLLLVVAAVLFVFVRHFAIPESFGDYGHFRASSVDEYSTKVALHGAPGDCTDCHDEEAAAHSLGKHGSVPCEVCHGPLGVHVEDEQRVAAMPINPSVELCGWCHHRLVARPKTFPQVVFRDHVLEKGGEMTEVICLECHDAHNPSE